MRFADQNKTKFAVSRGEIEEQLTEKFKSKLLRVLQNSKISKNIEKAIEDRLHNENINKIKRAQKQSKRKISDKYTPPSKHKQHLYITEGLSASGSLKQARDSENEGIYAIKGKIKNVRKLSDLTASTEWMDIISILEIEPGNKKLPAFDKIIIATDEDCIDENSLVITENGNKKIKDLTYSDKVLTHSGEFKGIEKIVETKKEENIEIEIDGKKINCSEYHILVVYRDNEIQEIFAKDLKETDFLLLKNE